MQHFAHLLLTEGMDFSLFLRDIRSEIWSDLNLLKGLYSVLVLIIEEPCLSTSEISRVQDMLSSKGDSLFFSPLFPAVLWDAGIRAET